MFVDLLRKLFDATSRSGKRNGRPVRRKKTAHRLRLEVLEDRSLPSTVNWIGGSGNWNDATRWLDAMTGTNHVPTASDDAVIAVDGITVTHDSTGSPHQAHSLSWTSSTDSFVFSGGTLTVLSGPTAVQIGTLTLSGGTLDVAGTLQASTFTLSGGTLAHATVNSTIVVTTASPSPLAVLDGVTLNGDLDLTGAPRRDLNVLDGLTLNGTAYLGNAAGTTHGNLWFSNTETFGGNATVLFGGASDALNLLYIPNPATTVTLGANLTVHGKNGQLYGTYSNDIFVNQGTIAADTAGGTITVVANAGSWSSSGTLRVAGGTLNLATSWSSSGLIDVSAGTLNLGGTFTTPTGTYSRSGGTVNLIGTLNNAGHTLTLDATTGSWNFSGRINGGIVNESGGSTLVVTTAYPSLAVLDGVTLNGDLDLTGAPRRDLSVLDGLTLNGTAYLGNTAGTTLGVLWFSNTETFGGNATVLFGGTSAGSNLLFIPNPATTVTLGANLTVHGKNGQLYGTYSNDTFVNQGTIAADTAGGTITVVANAGSWSNGGTVLASNGGTLSASTPTNYSSGTLTGGTWQVFAGSTLRVTMSTGIVTNAATILLNGANSNFYSASSGTTSAFAGFTTNANSLTVQNGRMFTTAGDFTNNGTLTIGAGSTFSVSGNLTNFDGTNLTGGTYVIAGMFQFTNANIQNNAATIVLDGSGAAQIIDQASNNGVANLSANAAGGSFTIQNARNFTSASDFNNAGTLTIGSGSTFTVTGNYTDTGTDSILSGGTLNLSLNGTSSGTVTNAGTLNLSAGGTYTVSGSYSQSGAVNIPAGATLSLTGTFTNFAGNTLTGGTYFVAGTFQFQNANVVTNAATLVLDGSGGGGLIIDQNSNNGLANLASNTGSFTLQNGASLTTAGAFSNAGTLAIGSGSTFTLSANGTSSGSVTTAGTLNLSAGSTLTVSGSYSQSGTVNIPAGATLSLTGTFANFAGNTLTGGTYFVAGTFQFQNANIVTNAATIVLDGSGAGQIINQNSTNGLANLATNTAAGSFTVQNGASLTTTAAFSNAGSVTIGAGSTLTVAGTYTEASSPTLGTTLSGGTLTVTGGGQVNIQAGGVLGGSGTINANVTNGGLVNPGGTGAAGLLTLNGNYTQTANGVLNIEIGGTNPGTGFDQLVISGTATLGGTLNVSLINGFVPTSGTAFQILTFGSASGTFATTNIDPSLGAPIYDPMDVTVVAN
jgi:hypothetical protein